MIFSQEPPLEAQIKTWLNMAGFFSLGKNWFWIAKVQQTVEQSIKQNYQIMKNQSEFSVLNHVGWKF